MKGAYARGGLSIITKQCDKLIKGVRAMKNIIAIIWDFDKTLVNGYMQDPIFEDYNVNSHDFWTEVNSLPKKYEEEQHVKVYPDTI